jgi:HlyD family secretion protein
MAVHSKRPRVVGSVAADEFSGRLLDLHRTPPSPKPRAVLYTLLCLVLAVIGLICFGQVDRTAVAVGRLVPATRVQVVQPSSGGVVHELLVKEGDRVSAGQLVARLDASVVRAKRTADESDLWIARLSSARIDAELAGQALVLPEGAPAPLAARITAQHRQNVRAHRVLVEQETLALGRMEAEQRALDAHVTELELTLDRLLEEQEALTSLLERGYVSRLHVLERERQRIGTEQQLVAERHRVRAGRTAIEQQRERIASIRAEYLRSLQAERVQATADVARMKATNVEADALVSSMELRAPVAGVVKDLAAHTIGEVLEPGAVLLKIVPIGEPLLAEVWIEGQDVTQVRAGQAVRLKFDGVDFRRYGPVSGSVRHVGADATAMGSPIPGDNAESSAADVLAFKALVDVDANDAGQRLGALRLSAGMRVTAEIVIGQRTILEYLLSPVVQVASEAGRES